MTYNPGRHQRRSIRLKGYDYSQVGAYFITLNTYKRQRLFGEIRDGKMILNQIGKIVEREWLISTEIRPEIGLDAWVIMPDHLHGIMIICYQDLQLDDGKMRAGKKGVAERKPRSLSSFVAGFKASVTKCVKPLCYSPNPTVWQRNYYESIVRDDRHLNNIRRYIFNNPQKWQNDPKKMNDKSQEILLDLFF
ncbi:MAG: transposase [Cyanobacteria bacterium RI_101]|nr:transposase [Cyanobacteria bacterium RI_101]